MHILSLIRLAIQFSTKHDVNNLYRVKDEGATEVERKLCRSVHFPEENSVFVRFSEFHIETLKRFRAYWTGHEILHLVAVSMRFLHMLLHQKNEDNFFMDLIRKSLYRSIFRFALQSVTSRNLSVFDYLRFVSMLLVSVIDLECSDSHIISFVGCAYKQSRTIAISRYS